MYKRSQIGWRCRRGVRELDVILERYLNEAFDASSDEEKSSFCRLLELSDPDLMDFLVMAKVPDNAELAALAKKIRSIALSDA